MFCFEEMSLNMGCVYNQNTSAKATSFYKLMTLFDFLSSLAIIRSILDLTVFVTQFLQGPEIDTANATHLTESLKSLICCKNNTVETFYKKCYSDILEIAYNIDIKECKPRRSNLHRNRNNVPSELIYDYFKKLVTLPLIDHLTVEDLTMLLFQLIVVLLLSHQKWCLFYKNVNWEERFSLFSDLFKDDFHVPKCWRQNWTYGKHID